MIKKSNLNKAELPLLNSISSYTQRRVLGDARGRGGPQIFGHANEYSASPAEPAATISHYKSIL